MVIGVVLQQVAKGASKIAPAASKYADYLYGYATGTGIGISLNPTIRGSYELWKGTNRSNIKARNLRWYNRTLRRRFKGDVLVESSDSQPETLFPGSPIQRSAVGHSKQYNRGVYRRRRKSTTKCVRRCYHKGRMGRNVAPKRFRKRYR